ncbi:MAG: hypoxanthine phosphoribosyltransferase [Hyphomicrobiales bacterium]|nr:hypoxanthine phosphoribosyltransferase [Hyphomicrobiales bacterium]
MPSSADPGPPGGAVPVADRLEVILDSETIARRVAELAESIAAAGLDNLVVIPILKGSFIFAADLIRALHTAALKPEVDFIFLSSYGTGTESSGRIAVLRDIETEVAGRNLLLVDDILESGRTLAYAKDLMMARRAARVATCVLLEKRVRRAVSIEADFRGFLCPDEFVVGYGMDLAHRYRELPFVGRLMRD